MDSKEEKKVSKQASRRHFLKEGAALAGLAAVGGIAAKAQMPREGNTRTEYVPDDQIPKEAIQKDPWTGEPRKEGDGSFVVDWTGTPQWEQYRKNIRAVGGPRYGTLERDPRLYGYRSKWDTASRIGVDGGSGAMGTSGQPTMPSATKTYFFSLLSPLQNQMGMVTPSGLHFTDEHGETPEIDPRQHRFTIFGMVDRPMTFTMEDIMDLPAVSRFHNVECNSDGTTNHHSRKEPWATPGDIYGELSCSEWTGVPLSKLLEMVGVKKGANWFWGAAQDEYNQSMSLPLWKALDDALIVYGQNGEFIRPEQGFPLRLLMPGFQGNSNIKRVRSLKITNEPGPWHRESRIYAETRPDDKITWFRYEMPPQSCILRPSGGQQLRRKGFYEIRGAAWSGGGKVTRVEVTVDGGKTWKDAQIHGPVHSKAITRFTLPWAWNGEEVIISSRCTDERGSTQPTTAEMAKFKGVDLETLKSRAYNRFNIPQPWKIDREGRVTNAVFAI